MSETAEKRTHFIRQMIQENLDSGLVDKVVTRFPPEPNGYLHVGHARSICLNFGMKADFNGQCYLRFDDTNPCKEEEEFVHAIIEDVKWLGFDWQEKLTYASDYYQAFYDFAIKLIEDGEAYVDSLSAEEIREYRGTLTEPGKESPYRNRSIEENLKLFSEMKEGKYQEGEHILRAKIDMSSGNINMRDPAIYRIRFSHHQRTGDKWCVYPMYDFAHPLSDALEGITHSLCTLEFQDHRPLYDWLIERFKPEVTPRQTEFARLNISHMMTSKRRLKALVDDGDVNGWDDPRMPTIRGMRKRGYPAKALREFCEITGISKSDSVIDMSLLEECVRDELNTTAPRIMCVFNPIKVVIENYPQDKEELLTLSNHPKDEDMGQRDIPFTRELYIDADDFMEEAPKKFFRLSPGKEVRLRGAYVIRCDEVIKDESGKVVELRCHYDENTLGKKPEGRKVKGVIHWVPKDHAISCDVNLLDRLFDVENPASYDDFKAHLNPKSWVTLNNCLIEPSVVVNPLNTAFQFERVGYFKLVDLQGQPVFNRIVGLRDTWNKSND